MRNFLRAVVLKVLYPLLMLAGAFFKDRKERFQHLVIDWNNRLVLANIRRFRTKRILLLLPHCLQVNECDVRITNDIYNCRRCGRCGINDLIEVAEEYRLKLFVATGGNLARRIVKDVRPAAIVAVACERDLSSGIVDSYPLPIIGIPNERPFGPCVNTRVSLEKVKEAIRLFGGD
ncbi:MAG: DUF116 domain-containing protein [Alphaproteobacteria bacterium]|uniref:DUF116 domain-containing protein n=1 Tax=Candidatus Nitrobium versatile TaxID=2884831 RepID=A0A953JCH1_9BACT|nr:DUF116 domain-containing protein [Candidatus Nitrobium versatile]